MIEGVILGKQFLIVFFWFWFFFIRIIIFLGVKSATFCAQGVILGKYFFLVKKVLVFCAEVIQGVILGK